MNLLVKEVGALLHEQQGLLEVISTISAEKDLKLLCGEHRVGAVQDGSAHFQMPMHTQQLLGQGRGSTRRGEYLDQFSHANDHVHRPRLCRLLGHELDVRLALLSYWAELIWTHLEQPEEERGPEKVLI